MEQSLCSQETDPSNETDMECSAEVMDEQKVIMDLQKEVLELKSKLNEAESKLNEAESELSRGLFRSENIKDDETLHWIFRYGMLMAFYDEVLLQSDASVMWQWSGPRSGCDYDDVKVGPSYTTTFR